jgi:AbrB family looped-hinge helix DNA binding protein
MSKTIKMDRSGRIVIPQDVRDRYGLLEGAARLEVRESAEGIILRPLPEEIPADRHSSGWIVFRSSQEEDSDPVHAVEEERERRHRELRGDS